MKRNDVKSTRQPDILTLEQWQSDIGGAPEVDGFTAREIASRLGWGIDRTRCELAEQIAAGRWYHAGWRRGKRSDGRAKLTPVYAPVKK